MATTFESDRIVAVLGPKYGTSLHANDLLARYYKDLGYTQPIVPGRFPAGDEKFNLFGASSVAAYFNRFVDVTALGVKLWHSAADHSAQHGQELLSWKDRQGNSAATALAGPAPLVGYDAVTGRSGIRYDPTNVETSVYGAGAFGLTQNKAGGTYVACFKPLNNNGSLFVLSTATGGARFQARTGSSTANKFTLGIRRLDADAFATLDSTTAFVTTGTVYIVTWRMDWSAATGTIRINGVQDATGALSTVGSTENLASSEGRISANTGGVAAFFDGFVYETMYFDSALSDANCLAVERWLGDVWSVAVA